jgi:hypothetical protein
MIIFISNFKQGEILTRCQSKHSMKKPKKKSHSKWSKLRFGNGDIYQEMIDLFYKKVIDKYTIVN